MQYPLQLLTIVLSIVDLEGTVSLTQHQTSLSRNVVAENTALIAKNYNAAFLGNRQLANENTEALFRNRLALVQSLPRDSEIQENYREIVMNKEKLAYLDHKSFLNGQVLSISLEMAALNAQAIAINRRIMEANENIKNYNSALIGE